MGILGIAVSSGGSFDGVMHAEFMLVNYFLAVSWNPRPTDSQKARSGGEEENNANEKLRARSNSTRHCFLLLLGARLGSRIESVESECEGGKC